MQKIIEEAAGKVAHSTKSDRDKAVKQTPGNVIIREEAAARCTTVTKKKGAQKNKRGKPEQIICLNAG